MPRGGALLLASLLLAGTLSATLGLGSPVKEKRGWTLNSAGYLLGPRNGNVKNMSAAAPAAAKDAIDNHRSFHDKHGLAGKRELQPENEARPGFERPLPEKDVVRTIIEFLTFLHRKEAGALDPTLPSAISSEDTEQP